MSAPSSLYWSMPVLKRDDRDVGVDGGLHGAGQGVGRGQRVGDAVDVAVDGVLDQGRLLGGRRIVRVLQVDVVLGRGGLGAGADLVPERVTRAPRG